MQGPYAVGIVSVVYSLFLLHIKSVSLQRSVVDEGEDKCCGRQ